jgi:hypothetical protein
MCVEDDYDMDVEGMIESVNHQEDESTNDSMDMMDEGA